jgi:hypothetical protein
MNGREEKEKEDDEISIRGRGERERGTHHSFNLWIAVIGILVI